METSTLIHLSLYIPIFLIVISAIINLIKPKKIQIITKIAMRQTMKTTIKQQMKAKIKMKPQTNTGS